MEMQPFRDYLIDPSPYEWHQLLTEWSWLLPSEFSVRHVNRFGDLFGVAPDGSIQMLDTGCGSLNRLADSYEDFLIKIGDAETARDWLLMPLVNRAVAAELTLGVGQCYSFKLPPVLGGQYAVDNMFALDLASHLGAYGSIHKQLVDVPDGSQVVIRTKDCDGVDGIEV